MTRNCLPGSTTLCTTHVPRLSSEGSDSEICDELTTKGPTQSNHVSSARQNRKRRRGFIEKRRRDRINSCLNELKRLVPSAYEKQGSQKLEKAEILQMTVEHLRIMQTRGLDNFMCGDPQKMTLDYQSMGFRECTSEVARFMATEELDIQDPLRVRLMNHLHTHLGYLSSSQQRLAAYNSFNQLAVNSPSWNSVPMPQPIASTAPPRFDSQATAVPGHFGGPIIPSVAQSTILSEPPAQSPYSYQPNYITSVGVSHVTSQQRTNDVIVQSIAGNVPPESSPMKAAPVFQFTPGNSPGSAAGQFMSSDNSPQSITTFPHRLPPLPDLKQYKAAWNSNPQHSFAC